MEKYGFVYIWRDKKRNKYYIGCHWGNIEDKYVCSSRPMLKVYNRRKKDFKRKILEYVYERESLLLREYHWLKMINPEELGKKYYNNKSTIFPSNLGKNHSEEHKQKISKSVKEKWQEPEYRNKTIRKVGEFKHSEKSKQQMSIERKGKTYEERMGEEKAEQTRKKQSSSLKGKVKTIEHRKALSLSHIGKKKGPMKEEHKKKISKTNKVIALERPKVTCPHCNKTGQRNVMLRWHFNNCKERKNE